MLERYDLSGEASVISDDNVLLGERIDSRKAFFTKLNRVGVSRKKRSLRSGNYRRGNMFAHRGYSQRVVVKAHFKRHNSGSAGAGNLRGHLSYITRDGAGVDEARPELFGSFGGADEDLSRAEFYNICKGDRHHFRVIISPENGHELGDFEGYIGKVMARVEEDLDTKLDWVSAVHYDTDNPHAHVVIRGRDDLGKDLVIAPDYISYGIRGVAEEMATEIMGERSLADIQRAMEKETDALRVTSLDHFIADKGREIEGVEDEFKVNLRGFGLEGRDEFKGYLVRKRLAFLTSTSLAQEVGRDIYHVRNDFRNVLKEQSEKQDIIKQLYRSMPEEEAGVSVYRIENDAAPIVRGEIEKIAHMNELTDHKYMVVRAADGELHYVPLALNDRNGALREGSYVEVSAGEKPSLKADRTILAIADQNDGVYSREAHLEHVSAHMKFIKEPEGYVDYHGGRAEALSKAGIVENLDEDAYRVPEDVMEQGAVLSAEQDAKYKRKQYAQVTSLSVVPIKDKALSIYDLSDEDAPKITGRVEQVERASSGSDKRYMLVRDGDEKAHYVPLSGKQDIKVGAIVGVSVGQKSRGGADYNIGMIADGNDGEYSRDVHLEFLKTSDKKKDIEDIDAYLDHHAARLKSLDQAGIVEVVEEGIYRVPEDVVDLGHKLNMSRGAHKIQNRAKVKVISAIDIEKQVDVHARTFLDLEIYRQQKNYNLAYEPADKSTLSALGKRKDWLAENGYASYKEDTGEFVMKGDALGMLYKEELQWAGDTLVKRHGVKGHEPLNLDQGDRFSYAGYTDLMAGKHLIVERADMYSLVKSPHNIGKLHMGEPLELSVDDKNNLDIKRFTLSKSKEEAIEMVSEREGLSYMDVDMSEGAVYGSFVGAINLKDKVYAVVREGENFSMFETQRYPHFNRGEEVILQDSGAGVVEIKELDKQRELKLDIEKPKQELGKDSDEIEIDDDWRD